MCVLVLHVCAPVQLCGEQVVTMCVNVRVGVLCCVCVGVCGCVWVGGCVFVSVSVGACAHHFAARWSPPSAHWKPATKC